MALQFVVLKILQIGLCFIRGNNSILMMLEGILTIKVIDFKSFFDYENMITTSLKYA